MALMFFYILILVIALGVPIVFALIFAPVLGIVLQDKLVFLSMMPQRIFSGINQFPLLAIPMFILAGEIMNHGGITLRLVCLRQDPGRPFQRRIGTSQYRFIHAVRRSFRLCCRRHFSLRFHPHPSDGEGRIYQTFRCGDHSGFLGN